MDFTTVLKDELFRPVTTIVVPGSVALSPYVLLTMHYIPQVASFWQQHPSAFVSIVVIAVITLGLIIDNVGTAIEYYAWDAILEKKSPGHWKRWQQYLQLEISDEYVGQRYLRNMLVRMKFELAMPTALLTFLVGLAWLNCLYAFWSPAAFAWFALLDVLGVVAFLWDSYCSASILADTRKLILEAKKTTGSEQQARVPAS